MSSFGVYVIGLVLSCPGTSETKIMDKIHDMGQQTYCIKTSENEFSGSIFIYLVGGKLFSCQYLVPICRKMCSKNFENRLTN